MQERLQKIISANGIASRRKAEELILNKAVKLNGQFANLGDKADLSKDIVEIKIKGKFKKISNQTQEKVYYLLHKPLGVVSSAVRRKKDEQIVLDFVPASPKVWPVGRLDKNTTGLILLTNDGELTQKISHPKFEHSKEYTVEVDKRLDADFLSKLEKGIKLHEGFAKPDYLKKIGDKKFIITLHQGWNRQIRRMCSLLGFKVVALKRTRINNLKLNNIKPGGYKQIKIKEINL
jgi:23S rRNA pseudouridine2605 synthase